MTMAPSAAHAGLALAGAAPSSSSERDGRPLSQRRAVVSLAGLAWVTHTSAVPGAPPLGCSTERPAASRICETRATVR